jgi:CheY-like chemotaxis protein
VRTLRSAAELWTALAAAHAGSALPQLLLLAERGPDFDGVAVCCDARRRSGIDDLPVILLTSRSDQALLERAYEAGVSDHLDQPILREELLLRVRSALRLAEETRTRKLREAELSETAARLTASLDRVAADLVAAARLQRSLLPAPTCLPGSCSTPTASPKPVPPARQWRCMAANGCWHSCRTRRWTSVWMRLSPTSRPGPATRDQATMPPCC